MNIDSVRALKAEIASQVVPPAVAEIQAAGGFAITTFSLGRLTKSEPLVALGIAAGSGPRDHRLAVRLQRHSLARSTSLTENILKRARGEADLRFVGRIAKHAIPWYRSRRRPLQPGISVGHYKITAGTLGAIATDKKTGQLMILSNNHVLANENDAKSGDAILQTGAYDGGKRPKDIVASLARWEKLQAKKPNLIDAAVAGVRKDITIDPTNYQGIGILQGVRADPIVPGLGVTKVGRTTGVTKGRISAIEVDNVVVDYDLGELSFNGQIEIEAIEVGAFSAGGDSGSLILDGENKACALLFAGSESGGSNGRGLTYANPIGQVLDELAINLQID